MTKQYCSIVYKLLYKKCRFSTTIIIIKPGSENSIMLLRQIQLHNIRSYTEATIVFPAGSILLAGDIGSGKSTILLAIEFALFGASRPDLPGEALLRKGTFSGSVELEFMLPGKELVIKRNLKRERDAVKQTPGYIITNGQKKDLTAVELKAEIISLLGYPEESLAKNKNYIFRYTVYTPQEEMKFILQEDPEIRQDILRKAFNIDKYKLIRENIQIYLRQLREKIRILEARLEPVDKVKLLVMETEQEKKSIELSLAGLQPSLQQIQEKIQQQREELQRWEGQERQYQEREQNCRTIVLILQEKQKQQRSVQHQREKVQQELSSYNIPEGWSMVIIEQEKRGMEDQLQTIREEEQTLKNNIKHLQQSLLDSQSEVEQLVRDLDTIPAKAEFQRQLLLSISEKEKLFTRKLELEESLLTMGERIAQQGIVLLKSKEVLKTITQLDYCPTCQQTVSPKHKRKVLEQEEGTIRSTEQILHEGRIKHQDFSLEKQSIEQHLDDIRAAEHALTRIKIELQQLEEKKQRQEYRQKQRASWIHELNLLHQRWKIMQQEELIPQLQKKVAEWQQLLQRAAKKQFLEQQLQDINTQLEHHTGSIAALQETYRQLELELGHTPKVREGLAQKRILLTESVEQEKTIAVEQARRSTQLQTLQKQEQELQQQLWELLELQQQARTKKELHHWLEEQVLNLTYTIEKQVMVHIHRLFNQLFQEWFGMLIEDESMLSKIDDTFTPVIEQNGYEIDFTQLSGGEKTSAALAYRLALNRVINEVIQQIHTKEVLILDEPTDGFSSEQLEKVREVLEKLHLGQTIIVSHESKIESFVDTVIRVRKEGQRSVVY